MEPYRVRGRIQRRSIQLLRSLSSSAATAGSPSASWHFARWPFERHDQGTTMKEIHEALAKALGAVTSVEGTDLVLTIGSPPMIRLDGTIRAVAGVGAIDEALMQLYLADLLEGDQIAELNGQRDVDFA